MKKTAESKFTATLSPMGYLKIPSQMDAIGFGPGVQVEIQVVDGALVVRRLRGEGAK